MIGYFMVYLGSRKYLETFSSGNDGESSDTLMNTTVFPPDKPYVTNPIDDLDDYEYSLIFQKEGSKEATKQQLNDAMSRYPLDWVTQPPDSQRFQDGQRKYLAETHKASEPNEKLYSTVNGSDMAPQDLQALDEEERKILQTYKPESSKGLLSYSVDDVKHLVDKLYSKKNLVPTVEKSRQGGPNVWEIVEVQPKDPHIVWEDDLERMTERDKATMRHEETIQVPYTVADTNAGLDPFFSAGPKVRSGKNSYYDKWTPGLERQFAPTYPIKAWL